MEDALTPEAAYAGGRQAGFGNRLETRKVPAMNATVFRLIAAAASFWLAGANVAAQDRSVSITLAGQLPPKCVLNNPSPTVDLGQLSQKGTASVFFSLSCNSDFHFALSSQNGGLAQREQARPPFITLVSYAVSVNLGARRISDLDRCHSSNMIGPFPSCSGSASANIAGPSAQNASLQFSWDFSGSVPLSGSYRDTLVLTVGPNF